MTTVDGQRTRRPGDARAARTSGVWARVEQAPVAANLYAAVEVLPLERVTEMVLRGAVGV